MSLLRRNESVVQEENDITWDMLTDSCSFPVPEFQTAIVVTVETCYGRKLPDFDFWDEVIKFASKGKKCQITKDQRPHLDDWLKANWFWFTEGMSPRTKTQLKYYMLMELYGSRD